MKKIRITVMRMASYPDLSAAYENPLEHACDMQLGQVFIADGRGCATAPGPASRPS